MNKLNNKRTVLVTGATGGLGTAMCKKLFTDGYKVIGNYHTKEKADKWMDNEEIAAKIQKDEWLHCPEVSNRKDDKFVKKNLYTYFDVLTSNIKYVNNKYSF